MQDIPHERVFTPAEVARVLRVDEETVRREIRRGRLGAVQVGRQYRLTSSDLMGWLGQVRFVELFTPYKALTSLLGSGNLDEIEAEKTALELTRRVRNTPSEQL